MSETVITALITLTAGAVGAVCGVIGAVKSARIAQKSQMNQAVVTEFMHVRVSAFSLLFDEWSKYVCANYDPTLLPGLIAAIEKTTMLATSSSHAILAEFRQALFTYAYSVRRTPEQQEKLQETTMNVRIALHYDLLRYYTPDSAELPEEAKLPNEVGRPRCK